MPVSGSEDGELQKKVRVRKMRGPPTAVPEHIAQRMDRRVAEIIPGLADLSLPDSLAAGAQQTAKELRIERLRKEQEVANELAELQDLYNFNKPHPVDQQLPTGPWTQQLRPTPRRIVLSQYQTEMINYQRMLLRKNIWYYRDRLNVPRGPCPLHVLKDCWVQGVIDENTLVWGHGLYDWLPARNVKLLLPMIRTPEGECSMGPVCSSRPFRLHVVQLSLHLIGCSRSVA
jgi:hypothetical protein